MVTLPAFSVAGIFYKKQKKVDWHQVRLIDYESENNRVIKLIKTESNVLTF